VVRMPELKSKSDMDGSEDLRSVAEECERLFKAAVKKIDEVYLDGTDEWIEENEPEISQELKHAEDELNEVWRRNIDGKSPICDLKQALKRYFEANMKAIEGYERHLLLEKSNKC
jgi:hypothetical protein